MEKLNNGPWSLQEEKMLKRFNVCMPKMYVITGVMPYESNEPKINDRVTVPEYFWTAYCCPSFSATANHIYFLRSAAVQRKLWKKIPMMAML